MSDTVTFLKKFIKETAFEINTGMVLAEAKHKKVHHHYVTKDGHHIHVHVHKTKHGHAAHFYNKTLGNELVKTIHWSSDAAFPSKREMELLGRETQTILENFLAEKDSSSSLDPDTAGKIAEHSAILHMIHHKHSELGTTGSVEHRSEAEHHEKAIHELSKGKNSEAVEVRKAHGKEIANAALAHIREKHGNTAFPSRVGHTAKNGDIGRFTHGQHDDSQENPSDMMVEVGHIKKGKVQPSKEKKYEGYSIKSSERASKITAKNPALDMEGDLDHPTRKFDIREKSEAALRSVHERTKKKFKLKDDITKAVHRKKIVDHFRKKEGVSSKSSIEAHASIEARASNEEMGSHLHEHLHHLLTNTGNEGHHMVRKMLRKHLTPRTSMPVSKIHTKGHRTDNVTATVTSLDNSPLRKILDNNKSRFAVSRKGPLVSIHHVDGKGNKTAIAHYRAKPKSNAFKESVHGWNVMPGEIH